MEKRFIGGGAGIVVGGLLLIFQETVRFAFQNFLSWLTKAGSASMTLPIAVDPINLVAIFLVALGVLAILWGPILNLIGWNKKITNIRLSIQFPGTPTETGHSNLWYWSWMWIQFTQNTPPHLKEVSSMFVWIFDRPVHYRQIKVTGQGITLPPYEVKQRTQKHCIVWFMGKVPDGEIDFELIF